MVNDNNIIQYNNDLLGQINEIKTSMNTILQADDMFYIESSNGNAHNIDSASANLSELYEKIERQISYVNNQIETAITLVNQEMATNRSLSEQVVE